MNRYFIKAFDLLRILRDIITYRRSFHKFSTHDHRLCFCIHNSFHSINFWIIWKLFKQIHCFLQTIGWMVGVFQVRFIRYNVDINCCQEAKCTIWKWNRRKQLIIVIFIAPYDGSIGQNQFISFANWLEQSVSKIKTVELRNYSRFDSKFQNEENKFLNISSITCGM